MKQHPEIDEKFIIQQQRKLKTEKKRLEEELSKVAVKGTRGYRTKWIQVGSDEDENAQESDTFTKNAGMEGELESLLQNVNSALNRMEEGTYGFDITDGMPIPKDRLAAFPSATMTKENESKLEKTLKKYIRGRGLRL